MTSRIKVERHNRLWRIGKLDALAGISMQVYNNGNTPYERGYWSGLAARVQWDIGTAEIKNKKRDNYPLGPRPSPHRLMGG